MYKKITLILLPLIQKFELPYSSTMIKILLPLFSSAFENRSYKYLPRQILHRNSNGKTSYFKREVQLRLAAITQFKKWPWKLHAEEYDVIHSRQHGSLSNGCSR